MKPYLLDVNLLIALTWSSHVHHAASQRWFSRRRSAGFRTCPTTQAGFVRLSSNVAFTAAAVTPQGALGLLDRITDLPEHAFWPDDLSLREAIGLAQQVVGHRQITDAYLLSLTLVRGGMFATLDRGVMAVAGSRADAVELVQ